MEHNTSILLGSSFILPEGCYPTAAVLRRGQGRTSHKILRVVPHTGAQTKRMGIRSHHPNGAGRKRRTHRERARHYHEYGTAPHSPDHKGDVHTEQHSHQAQR